MHSREHTAADQAMTADELFARQTGRCELIAGELIEMPPSGGRHGRLSADLARRIASHVHHQRCGRVYGGETGFILDRNPDTVRAPDVAYVASDRVIDTEHFLEQAPDLAVEVLAPSDDSGAVDRKVHQFLDAGTRQIWVVDPGAERVLIYRRGHKAAFDLGPGDAIEGGEVLPGFTLSLRELFDPDA